MKKMFTIAGLIYIFMSFMNITHDMEWRTWSLGATICFGFVLVFIELDKIKKKIENKTEPN